MINARAESYFEFKALLLIFKEHVVVSKISWDLGFTIVRPVFCDYFIGKKEDYPTVVVDVQLILHLV